MPTNPVINLPFDLTGVAASNYITNEEHNVSNVARAVATNYGPFYSEGLVVKDAFTDRILTPVVDYVVGLMYLKASEDTNKSVYVFVVINDLTLTKIKIDYHAVGGEFSAYSGAIQQILDSLSLDDRAVEWGSILGRPTHFIPAPHTHRANQIGQYGDLINSVERLTQAILTGNQSVISELYVWVQSQMNSAATVIASVPVAIEGTDNSQRITPYNLKAVLDNRFGSIELAEFEYEIDEVDDDWGYWRHKQSGFTVCWGTSLAIGSAEAYRVFYRRRFNVKPTVAGSFVVSTSDNNPSGTQWVELTGGIVDHTLSNEGLYVAANRINGTGNDKARFKYIAIGLSDDDQPLAASEGSIGMVPPSGGTVAQPIWSGTQTINMTTDATTAYRMGILFTPATSGGGHTFITTGQTAGSQFYYTPYGNLFTDADYEIKATIVATTFNSNLLYTGLTLDAWHDLGTVKAMDPTLLGSGFTWTTSGLYGGVTTLNVTIRKKSDITKIATRTFTFDRNSIVSNISTDISYGNEVERRFIGNDTTTKAINVTCQNTASNVTITLNAPGVFDSRSFNFTGITIADLSQYDIRLHVSSLGVSDVLTTNGGYTAVDTANPETGWYNLATVCGGGGYFGLKSNSTSRRFMYTLVQIRHRTDTRKNAYGQMLIVRIGLNDIAVVSGFPNTNHAVASGTLITYEVHFSNVTADGLGKVKVTGNGATLQETQFSYSFGLPTWDDDDAQVDAASSVNGSTLTTATNGWRTEFLSDSSIFTWQGYITQTTTITSTWRWYKASLSGYPEARTEHNATASFTLS